jgi:hypothetical protein
MLTLLPFESFKTCTRGTYEGDLISAPEKSGCDENFDGTSEEVMPARHFTLMELLGYFAILKA